MQFSLNPRSTPTIDTPYRKIKTQIPVPESIPTLKRLEKNEPRSMSSQAPIIWDRAEDFQVYDRYGNVWLDWSSGVLVTNSGHSHPKVREAIVDAVNAGLLHNYAFPNEIREALTSKLVELAPEPLDKAYLLTTGSEATECAMKLARWHGRSISPSKSVIVSFHNAFHGRTLGAQLAGGIPSLKTWIGELPAGYHQVSFPDGYRNVDKEFDSFTNQLAQQEISASSVAGVIMETYQGGDASFAPVEYIRDLRQWCDQHDVLLIFDEVQAGFGRTGKLFGFEHYGVVPDLICCGKGISSSLPVSAVLGSADVLNLPGVGEMTSTHAGNPICCAAAVANLNVLEDERLIENAAKVGEVLHQGLQDIAQKYRDVIGFVHGKGLVAGVLVVESGTTEPDGQLAFEIVENAIRSGLMLFAPVGKGGGTVKISPPLTISEPAVMDGLEALDRAIATALQARAEQYA